MPQFQLGLEEEWMEDFEKASFRDEVKPNLQLAKLDYVTNSQAAATSLAENYVGQAFEE